MKIPEGPYFTKFLREDTVEHAVECLRLMLNVFSMCCGEELSLECRPEVSADWPANLLLRFPQELSEHARRRRIFNFLGCVKGGRFERSCQVQVLRCGIPHVTVMFWDEFPELGFDSETELAMEMRLLDSRVADTTTTFPRKRMSLWKALTTPPEPSFIVAGRAADVYLEAKLRSVAGVKHKLLSGEAHGVSPYHEVRSALGFAIANQGDDIVRIGYTRKLMRRFLAEADERILRSIGKEGLAVALQRVGIGVEEWLAGDGRF